MAMSHDKRPNLSLIVDYYVTISLIRVHRYRRSSAYSGVERKSYSQRGRGRPEFADQTWAVDESMRSETSLEPPTIEKQVRDLSDLGYSTEVAQAIVDNEESARLRRN